jgi:peptidyl-prolyl cis-trans isomerase C
MRELLRPWLATLLVGGLASPALAQAPVPARPVSAKERVPAPAANARSVAVTVNGEPILEGAIQRALRRLPPDRHAESREPVLNLLVENTLIEQFLSQSGIKVDPAEVDKKLKEMKDEIVKEKLDYAKVLQEMEITEAELKKELGSFIRWEKYCDGQAHDKVLKDLFASSKEMFDGSAVRVRHILLSPDTRDPRKVQEARTLLVQIKQAIDGHVAGGLAKLPATDAASREKARLKLVEDAFAGYAKERSACPSKARGGDVGWFDRSGMMVEPFARAAFALQPFQISDVVETQFGVHLILLLDRKPGKDVKFEDVKGNVKEVYLERLRDSLVQGLRARAKIAQGR